MRAFPRLLVLCVLPGCTLVDPARGEAVFGGAVVDTAAADGADGGDGSSSDGADGTGADGADGTAADGTDGTDGTSTDGTDTGTPAPQPCEEDWVSSRVFDLRRLGLNETQSEDLDFSGSTGSTLAVASGADGLTGDARYESTGPEGLFRTVLAPRTQVWVTVTERRPATGTGEVHTLLAALDDCPRSAACVDTPEERCIGEVEAGQWFEERTEGRLEVSNASDEDREFLLLVDQKTSESMSTGVLVLTVAALP